jgi:hypothetical protein
MKVAFESVIHEFGGLTALSHFEKRGKFSFLPLGPYKVDVLVFRLIKFRLLISLSNKSF